MNEKQKREDDIRHRNYLKNIAWMFSEDKEAKAAAAISEKSMESLKKKYAAVPRPR